MRAAFLKAEAHATEKTHKSVIGIALAHGRVGLCDLRAAVHFYYDGAGKELQKPCCRHEWTHLLAWIGVAANPEKLSGKFRPC